MRRWLALPLAILFALPALADGLTPGGTAQVVEAIDGDTVQLADGRTVRLVGIQAPKLPLGRPGIAKWPLADEARGALERLALGEEVTLAYGGARMDRHGRALAHLYLADGRWLQGELLRAGLARVYTFPDNRALLPELLAAERTARERRAGIWRHPFYRVRDAADPAAIGEGFQLVEGRVAAVAPARGRTYVNFGTDFRTDFTVVIEAGARRAFAEARLEPRTLEGRLVRVRGWVRRWNGPAIEASHPEQIEVLQ